MKPTLFGLFILAHVFLRPSAVAANRALLVGVADYPALGAEYSLQGPTNDVVLFHRVLTNLGFPSHGITILASDRPSLQPTLSAIRRELERLARLATNGDQVVVYLSGHGARQPSKPDAIDDEPDGCDEVFLPADAAKPDLDARYIPNALVDDEIGERLTAIRSKGAFVWFLADCCHSGTITRGGPEGLVMRRVPMESLFPQAKECAQPHATRSRFGRTKGSLVDSVGTSGLVAMFACEPHQTTHELFLPPGSKAKLGLFTYALSQALLQARKPPTYRELGDSLVAIYSNEFGFQELRPSMESASEADLQDGVLGGAFLPNQPRLELRGTSGSSPWAVNAGSVFGLRPGAVVRVFPPDADDRLKSASALGYMRVTESDPFVARLQPVTYNAVPPPGRRLREGCRIEIVSIPPANIRLRFVLQEVASPGGGVRTCSPGNGPRGLENTLQLLAADPEVGNLLERTTELLTPDLHLLWVRSLRRLEIQRPFPEIHRKSLAHIESSKFLPTTIGWLDGEDLESPSRPKQKLQEMTRGVSMVKLAAPPSHPAVVLGRLGLEITMNRHQSREDGVGTPADSTSAARHLRPGDIISFSLRNTGATHVDVTLFHMKADFSLETLMKAPDRTLAPGASCRSDRWIVDEDGFGPECAIAIVTPAGLRRQNDFSHLGEPASAERDGGTRKQGSLPPWEYTAGSGSRSETRVASKESAGFGEYLVTLLPYLVTR